MTAPSIEYGLLSPMLIVFGAAIVGVLVEAFLPRRRRYLTQVALAVAGLAAALATVVTTYATMNAGSGRLAAMGAVTIDRPGRGRRSPRRRRRGWKTRMRQGRTACPTPRPDWRRSHR